TYKQASEQGYVALSEQESQVVDGVSILKARADDLRTLIAKVYGPGGPLAMVTTKGGASGRAQGYVQMVTQARAQGNPDLAALDLALAEYGVIATRTTEGAKGNIAAKLMQPAGDRRPPLGE